MKLWRPFFRSILGLMLIVNPLLSAPPTGFFTADDQFLRLPMPRPGWRFAASVFAEYSQNGRAYDATGATTNIASAYNPTESVLAMLRNPLDDVATKIAGSINPRLAALSDLGGRRGRLLFSAKHQQTVITLAGGVSLPQTRLPGVFMLSCHCPLVSVRMNDVNFRPTSTLVLGIADLELAELYANLPQALKNLGGLHLDSTWQNSGVGDTAFMLDWRHEATAGLSGNIKSLGTFVRLGCLVPFGETSDEDVVLSQPFGTDGHWGLPIDAGMEINFSGPWQVLLGADFLWLFHRIKERRLKTDLTQTSLLLLNKGIAYKQPGLTWRFKGGLSADHLWRGLSVSALYRFTMHHNDRLYPRSSEFDDAIVNSAPALKTAYLSQLIGIISYDLKHELRCRDVCPTLRLLGKMPLAGKYFTKGFLVGGELAIAF